MRRILVAAVIMAAAFVQGSSSADPPCGEPGCSRQIVSGPCIAQQAQNGVHPPNREICRGP